MSGATLEAIYRFHECSVRSQVEEAKLLHLNSSLVYGAVRVSSSFFVDKRFLFEIHLFTRRLLPSLETMKLHFSIVLLRKFVFRIRFTV